MGKFLLKLSKYKHHWVLILVLFLFSSIVLIVPVLTPVPINDDWMYTRIIEKFLENGQLLIYDIKTLVFQIIWGSVFAKVLSLLGIFGSLRISTIIIVFLSSLALYKICLEINISPNRSAFGVAVYLFNPLMFVLTYTFLTDPHYTATLIIAIYLYIRGLNRHQSGFLIVGSILAGLAFLVRQTGLFILAGVMTFFIANRFSKREFNNYLSIIQMLVPGVIIISLYYFWFDELIGVPQSQAAYTGVILGAETWQFIILIIVWVFIAAMYAGFFGLPLVIGVIPNIKHYWREVSPNSRRILFTIFLFILICLIFTAGIGMLMPYIPHFLSRAGLGPNDLVVSRPALVGRSDLFLPTIASAIGFLIIMLVLLTSKNKSHNSSIAFLIHLGVWQLVGYFFLSSGFRKWSEDGIWTPSLDRYLLPLLPFLIIFFLYAIRGKKFNTLLAWSVTIFFALFAIIGTRDSLIFHESTWELARRANELGIENLQLDAGATWDAYHLYDYSKENNISVQTPEYIFEVENPDALIEWTPPWWIVAWAPAVDSTYIIAGEDLPGFEVVEQVEYDAWMLKEPVRLYLLERPRK